MIKITDLFGAHVDVFVEDPSQIHGKTIGTQVLRNTAANPFALNALPALCPRVRFVDDGGKKRLIYDTRFDVLNGRPKMQLFDPDYKRLKNQQKILDVFDLKNVLAVRRVKITYDYEDTSLVDYMGPHPITKEPHIVYEGEGGFYANFHYAVVPFDERIKHLGRQELLNLAQGKLAYINREDLTPELRTHGFLPGPYLSPDRSYFYEMCEWGDTTFQAAEQEVSYERLFIWDWDLWDGVKGPRSKGQGRGGDKVMVIVWEGDEEDWLIADGLLDPYYLTDDLVGLFVVEREKTLKPLVLKNEAANFEIELLTVDP